MHKVLSSKTFVKIGKFFYHGSLHCLERNTVVVKSFEIAVYFQNIFVESFRENHPYDVAEVISSPVGF